MSNEHENIYDAIIARIVANLTTIDVGWGNDDVQWPSSELHLAGRTDWMRVEIHDTGTNQAVFGGANSAERFEGFLQLTFFAKFQAGVDIAKQIAARIDAARTVFPNGLSLAAGSNNIRFDPGRAAFVDSEFGITDYRQEALLCPWRMDNF